MRQAIVAIAVRVFRELEMDIGDVDRIEKRDGMSDIAFARHVIVWLARRRLDLSYPALGREFGGRDHTTVMSSVRKVERAIARFRAEQARGNEKRLAEVALSVLHAMPGPERVIPGVVSTSGAREIEIELDWAGGAE